MASLHHYHGQPAPPAPSGTYDPAEGPGPYIPNYQQQYAHGYPPPQQGLQHPPAYAGHGYPPPPPVPQAPPGSSSVPPPPPEEPTLRKEGRRQETEEERRRRKEKERRRHEEQKRQEQKRQEQKKQQSRGGSAKEKRVVQADNRLRRPTTFQSKIRFQNELPDVLMEPKFMASMLQPDRYTKYTITTLEKEYEYKLHVEPDLGIPLDLLDLRAYNAPPPEKRPPLAPEDAALLLETTTAKARPVHRIHRLKDRPKDEGMKWLVGTSYISGIESDAKPKTLGLSEKQAKQMRDEKENKGEQVDLTDREQQMKAIEATFAAAKQPPKHPTNPNAKVEWVLPLLPDADRWANKYVQVLFDNEPTAEGEKHMHLDKEIRQALEARAMMKSYHVPRENQEPERFMAYMVPTVDEVAEDPEDREVEYDWVREYHWALQPSESGRDTYLFVLRDDAATYLPLKAKIVCNKKRAKQGKKDRRGDEEEEAFLEPATVTVRKRSLKDIEEDRQARAAEEARKADESGERARRREEEDDERERARSDDEDRQVQYMDEDGGVDDDEDAQERTRRRDRRNFSDSDDEQIRQPKRRQAVSDEDDGVDTNRRVVRDDDDGSD